MTILMPTVTLWNGAGLMRLAHLCQCNANPILAIVFKYTRSLLTEHCCVPKDESYRQILASCSKANDFRTTFDVK